jgi:hypothetical protein
VVQKKAGGWKDPGEELTVTCIKDKISNGTIKAQ